MAIIINLDVVMAKNKIGLTELANEVDITLVNPLGPGNGQTHI